MIVLPPSTSEPIRDTDYLLSAVRGGRTALTRLVERKAHILSLVHRVREKRTEDWGFISFHLDCPRDSDKGNSPVWSKQYLQHFHDEDDLLMMATEGSGEIHIWYLPEVWLTYDDEALLKAIHTQFDLEVSRASLAKAKKEVDNREERRVQYEALKAEFETLSKPTPPVKPCTCTRSGYEGFPCPVHSP